MLILFCLGYGPTILCNLRMRGIQRGKEMGLTAETVCRDGTVGSMNDSIMDHEAEYHIMGVHQCTSYRSKGLFLFSKKNKIQIRL